MSQPTAQPTGTTLHIWCSAQINKKLEDVFVQMVLGQNQQKGVSKYIVYLSTPGGNPFVAVDLYNFLKSISQETVVYNMGSVASAGVPIFLAFQKRYAVPDSSFMIHQTTIPRSALSEQASASDLESQTKSLLITDRKTQTIIEKETRPRASKPLSKRAIQAAARTSMTYGAAEAKEHGFIDDIEMPKIPNENVVFLTDQWLATLPG